jgi:hypothetical protein
VNRSQALATVGSAFAAATPPGYHGDDVGYPNRQLAVVLYRVDFVTKRQDAANRFMVADVRALRELTAAGVTRTGHINSASVRDDIATFTAHQCITADTPLDSIVDMQFVNHANKTLGRG